MEIDHRFHKIRIRHSFLCYGYKYSYGGDLRLSGIAGKFNTLPGSVLTDIILKL